MRLALIIRLTIGKAYYENTFRVFHHSLINALGTATVFFVFAITNGCSLFLSLTVINQEKMEKSYQESSSK